MLLEFAGLSLKGCQCWHAWAQLHQVILVAILRKSRCKFDESGMEQNPAIGFHA
jgi:hypothetical protein